MHLLWDVHRLGQLVIHQEGARSRRLGPAVAATEVFLPHRCRSVAVGTQRNIVLLTNDSHCQTGRISEGGGKKAFLSFKDTVNLLLPFLLRSFSVFIKII